MQSYRHFFSDTFSNPAIAVHRGAWHTAPENSIAAVLNAANAGYAIAEIDIQCSADGELFVLHDRTLRRMARREEIAAELPLEQLMNTTLVEIDGSQGAQFTEHRVPSLREMLAAAKGKIYLDLDIKWDADILEQVCALVKEFDMREQASIKMSVLESADAHKLLDLEQHFNMMVKPKIIFSEERCDALLELCALIQPSVIETKFDHLDTLKKIVPILHQQGTAIWVNTLDSVACCGLSDSQALKAPARVWGTLFKAGVRTIQTDEPATLADYIAIWKES